MNKIDFRGIAPEEIEMVQYNMAQGVWHAIDEDRRKTYCGMDSSRGAESFPETWKGLAGRCQKCNAARPAPKFGREDNR